jgi:hypothetical protein
MKQAISFSDEKTHVLRIVSLWPQTVGEAVDRILAFLPPKDRDAVKRLTEGNLPCLHFGLGQRIRNEFGLWGGNTELLSSCGSETMHPDHASGVILRALWEKLQKE